MTKGEIQARIDEKQKELDTLIQSDQQDQQSRQQRLQANQIRVNQLQGGIEVLNELLPLIEEITPAQ